MSIDNQRIAAVAALEALGFKYTSDRGWLPPIKGGRETIGGILPDFTAEADAMHALLVIRADVLMGEPEASQPATADAYLQQATLTTMRQRPAMMGRSVSGL